MRIVLILVLMITVLGCDKLPWNHKKNQLIRQETHVSEIRTVKDIQFVLKKWDYYKGPINGKSSPALIRAIKEFQKNNGLVVDGEAGAKTRAKLKELLETSSIKE